MYEKAAQQPSEADKVITEICTWRSWSALLRPHYSAFHRRRHQPTEVQHMSSCLCPFAPTVAKHVTAGASNSALAALMATAAVAYLVLQCANWSIGITQPNHAQRGLSSGERGEKFSPFGSGGELEKSCGEPVEQEPLTAPGRRRQPPCSARNEPQANKHGPASDGSAHRGSQQPAATSVTSPGSPDSEANESAEEGQLISEAELESEGESPAAEEVLGPSSGDTASSSAQSADFELPRELLELYLSEALSFRKQASKDALYEGLRLPAEVTSSSQTKQGTVTRVSSSCPPLSITTGSSNSSSGSSQLPSAPQAVSSPKAGPSSDAELTRLQASVQQNHEGNEAYSYASLPPGNPVSAPTSTATSDWGRLRNNSRSRPFKDEDHRELPDELLSSYLDETLLDAEAAASEKWLFDPEVEATLAPLLREVDEPHASPQTEATTKGATEKSPFPAVRAGLFLSPEARPSTDVNTTERTTIWDDRVSTQSAEKEIPHLRDEGALSVLVSYELIWSAQPDCGRLCYVLTCASAHLLSRAPRRQ
ncbi:hypothetical protein Efla_001984 [Eimeria flavescens]